ncbi:hypothetical protein ACW5WQ_21225 [Aeromonas rivuli]|uniref:hypothetical protein n=1 Tax=Aeromonas rivuli TaxID=648794 RepID=UPI0012EDC890|nr:hypothetical protein [Aeromonas rivuli]
MYHKEHYSSVVIPEYDIIQDFEIDPLGFVCFRLEWGESMSHTKKTGREFDVCYIVTINPRLSPDIYRILRKQYGGAYCGFTVSEKPITEHHLKLFRIKMMNFVSLVNDGIKRILTITE